MPSNHEYETVKQQCNSIEALGAFYWLNIANDRVYFGEPRILIVLGNKTYRFCDPDWNIVISQLSTLYRSLKNEKSQRGSSKRETKA